MHLNFCPAERPDGFDDSSLDHFDRQCVERQEYTERVNMSYRDEHALKPATIGFVCDADPVALLAWYAADPPSRKAKSVDLVVRSS